MSRRPRSPPLFPYTTLFGSGTTWNDNYPANRGRQIRIDQVDERHAYATVTANRATARRDVRGRTVRILLQAFHDGPARIGYSPDRKSTRLNSSHLVNSHAVF